MRAYAAERGERIRKEYGRETRLREKGGRGRAMKLLEKEEEENEEQRRRTDDS